ncbi:hypothetical protein BH10ACI2_BH10ACI2_03870 [soil metagenome]
MESRSREQIREHYEIEREIASRLRNSTDEERQTLYAWAYDELFRKVTDHPMLVPASEDTSEIYLGKELRNLEGFVTKDTIFVEIGPGDCSLSKELAKRAKKVIAIDVSKEITTQPATSDNFQLIISDGSSIPVPAMSVDVIYSNQLMEHLHPDDSLKQLGNIYNALKKGGIYFCVTPNRLSGPHDISRTFDDVATGLHLYEYTLTELEKIFQEVGFTKIRVFLRVSKFKFLLPVLPYKMMEYFLETVPHSLRRILTFNKVVRYFLGVKAVATK